MAVFTLNIEKELNDQLTVKQDGGSLIWNNSEANRVVVTILDAGTPVTLTGTVQAKMLRADGQTEVWNGDIIDGAAVVTLPASAYAVQGPAELNVDLVDGSQRMTLVVLRMMVDATTSNAEVAPVDTVPNLAALLAKIAEMEAATQAAQEASAFYPMVYTGNAAFPSEGGNTYYAFGSMTKGTTVVTPSTGESTHYLLIIGDLIAGETFTITARDGTTARPWGMADKDGVLQNCASGQSVTDAVVTVPESCAGGTLYVQVRNTYIGTASVVRHLNLKRLNETLEGVTERLNLFDDTLTYRQTQADGTNDGTRSPTDGAYTTNKSWKGHGQRWWCITDKTLPAGTYTLSAYVELATANNRMLYMGIGRGSGVKPVYLTTERGGTTLIDENATAGWAVRTVTLTEEKPWGVAFNPVDTSDQASTISQIQLEKGAVLTAYTEDDISAVDTVARALIEDMSAEAADASTAMTELLALQQASGLSDSFFFFTDPHLTELSNWQVGFEKWMPVLGSYFRQLPVHFALCGGDWLGNSDTREAAMAKLGLIYTEMRKQLSPFHMCVGNHDVNEQGVEYEGDERGWTGRLTCQAYSNVWYNGRSYYDFFTPSARYFVLDTGGGSNQAPYSTYYAAEREWLAAQLMANTAANVVFVQHIVYNTDEVVDGVPTTNTPQHGVASSFLKLAQAFNAKGSVTIGGVTYNFTGTTGKVRFVIAGHTHYDNISTAYGLPIWITGRTFSADIASLRRIDLMVADFENGVVKAVRVGAAATDPAVRTMTMA